MKKYFNFWLMLLLMGGLSMGVTSCKDDDDNDDSSGSGGDDEELVLGPTDTDEAHAAYLWLGHMTDMEDFTDDWASKTYEPTIGEQSKNNSQIRVVCVSDLDMAKMNFSSMSCIDPDKLSTSQTQSIEGVGSVTWTPSPEGAENLAVVDVNTKLIPHLSRIVYCTIEQAGENGGAYSGTAYFRFGDVVEDGEGYYWVCVRPPFGSGTAAQQQGYWINILNRDPVNGKSSQGRVPVIPKNNMFDDYNAKKKYNGNTIILPTHLNSKKEYVHDLSNLIWALLDPTAYKNAAGSGSSAVGLGGYEYKYNGAKFAKRVADEWTKQHIWEKLFNRTYEQMKEMKKLNFYYDGKYWAVGSTGSVPKQTTTKYEKTASSTFSQDKNNNYVELQDAGAGYDMRRYCSDPDQNPKCASKGSSNYAPAEQFSSSQGGHWIVRQKNSSQLAGTSSHPSVYVNLKNMTEIYRYNLTNRQGVGNNFPVETENDIASEVAPEDIAVGNILGQNGKFYAHAKYARQMGTTPIAIVAYVTGNSTSKFVEESKGFKEEKYNCLLMSLTRKTNKVKWSESLYTDSCQVNFLTNFTNEPTGMEGLGNTTNLCNNCGKKHNHPAAEQCEKTNLPDDATNFSSWFLPSVAQFEMAVKTLGGFTWSTSNGFGSASQKDSKMTQLRKKFEEAGVETEFDVLVRDTPLYWTSTLTENKKSEKAFCFMFQYFLNSGENLSTFAKGVQDEAYVLPFIAFKYEAKR
jgi:hypothetical protein